MHPNMLRVFMLACITSALAYPSTAYPTTASDFPTTASVSSTTASVSSTTASVSSTTASGYPTTESASSTTASVSSTTASASSTTAPAYPTTASASSTTASGYPTTESASSTTASVSSTTAYPTTSSASAYSKRENCPNGWVNSADGCFLFHDTNASNWKDAREECEALGGFLAEVKSEEQAVLLTSLAVVQEDILGITAWWIGLTDQGHEGRWIWQHSIEDTGYTNWAPNYPGSNNPQDDCAVMTSRDSFMWSDTDCEGLVASPVCQREIDAATTTTETPTTTAQEYHVELRDSNDYNTGNVFVVNRNGYLGPVCDDDWSDVAATVVCKQLGFSTGKATIESKFGRVPMDFAMDDVVCTGEEATIQECDYIWDDNCNSGEGAGVVCHGGDAETTTVDTPTTTTVDIATTTAGTEPTTTEIATTTMQAYYVELKDGNGYNSGNLFAVNSNGYFGPVCDDDWSDVAAAVVCKQLGFITGVAYWASHFGNVPSEFAMDNVECTGEEATIQDCDYVSTSDCSVDEGAGVMCEFEGERDNVQLKDGNGYNTGNVFALNRNDYFGPVCDDDWSDVAATVVCKQLGFNTGRAVMGSTYGLVPSNFAMDDILCTGEEATIQECAYISHDDCNNNEGAGVVCE